MPKIQRKTQKIFCNSADSDQIAVFGSMATGNPVYSNDVEQLQSNEAYEIGWDAATLEDKAPFMEEMNGMQYGITKQLAYNFQEGIPEYDTGTTYYIGSIVKVLEDNKPVLYTSLTDENLGNNPVTDATNWERLSFGGGLEIGDIGIAPLGIDETKGKRRYLNGQIIIQDQYMQFTNKVKSAVALYPTLACTEEEWQATATMTVGGQVGKFVVNDEAGTIRLPKIIMPIQGLTDLSKLAEIVEAGLPNITGEFGAFYNNYLTGAFTVAQDGVTGHGSSNTQNIRVSFDASRSNPIYGNSDTVQQEQIQYPYFIQVATGAETEDNIINEIELNNPFFFGMSQYFESEPNNISWLKSAGQYNSKAIYPAYYDWLLKIYNGTETVEGVSVKLVTETYDDYDWVLNTADETFRLPLLDGSEDLPSDRYVNLTIKASGSTYTAPANGWYTARIVANSGSAWIHLANTNNGINAECISTEFTQPKVNVEAKKGDVIELLYFNANTSNTDNYFRFVYAQGNGSLYFYVGETVQNANLINAGRIEEKIASLIPDNSSLISGYGMPSNRYIDLTLGASGSTYIAPANGWVFIMKRASAVSQILFIGANGVCSSQESYSTNMWMRVYIPIKKNEEFTVSYTAGGETREFFFIYAEGEV